MVWVVRVALGSLVLNFSSTAGVSDSTAETSGRDQQVLHFSDKSERISL